MRARWSVDQVRGCGPDLTWQRVDQGGGLNTSWIARDDPDLTQWRVDHVRRHIFDLTQWSVDRVRGRDLDLTWQRVDQGEGLYTFWFARIDPDLTQWRVDHVRRCIFD